VTRIWRVTVNYFGSLKEVRVRNINYWVDLLLFNVMGSPMQRHVNLNRLTKRKNRNYFCLIMTIFNNYFVACCILISRFGLFGKVVSKENNLRNQPNRKKNCLCWLTVLCHFLAHLAKDHVSFFCHNLAVCPLSFVVG
jgi:hypothetical protein